MASAYATQPPAGINPVDYINYLARLQQWQQGSANARADQSNRVFAQLLQQAQAMDQEARNANELRRNEILQGRTDTRNRILGQWNQIGDSLIADTNRDYAKNLGDSLAALNDTGLLHSSVNADIRARNARERNDAMRRVKDQIGSQYANADERLSNEIDAFNERVVDAYPDTSNLMSLAAQTGAIIPGAASAYMGGGMAGGVGGGMGGGSYRSRTAAPRLPQPTAPTPTLQQLRQQDTVNSTNPNAYMASLFAASHPASGTAQDPINQVLWQGILTGQAQWNPNPGTPTVPVFPTYSVPNMGGGGGGGYAQRPARPKQGSNPAYNARIHPTTRPAGYLNSRPSSAVKSMLGNPMAVPPGYSPWEVNSTYNMANQFGWG